MEKKKDRDERKFVLDRRGFLIVSAAAAVVAGSPGKSQASKSRPLHKGPVNSEYPPSEGYLVVDTKKCQGCMSCMVACSTAHEGKSDLSLARIQVVQNPYGKFPGDIFIGQCRQCVEPACVKKCPAGALIVDEENGMVRRVDQAKCEGCMICVGSCRFAPGRAIWNFKKQLASKCDLCVDAPFWKEKGGPGGKQACVEVCPLNAIKFQSEIPLQEGNSGYDVNLRGKTWKRLGYSTK